MELEFNQVSVYFVVKWDIWPGIVRIVGRVNDSGINLKRAFGSFVGMTGDRDVSLPVLTTIPQREIVQYSDFSISHVIVEDVVQNTVVLLGLRRNHSQFHLLLQRSNAHLGQC